MSKGHLYGIVYDALRRLQTTPQIIKGFFADPVLRTFPDSPSFHLRPQKPIFLFGMEIQQQDVELLPAGTVLSLACNVSCSKTSTTNTSGTSSTSSAAGTSATPPIAASTAAAPSSGPTFTANNLFLFLATNQCNTITGGAAGTTTASGTGAAGTTGAVTTSAG